MGMQHDDLKARIGEMIPSAVFEDGSEWTTVHIDAAAWEDLARRLRSDGDLDFDYLFCLTAVDWKTHFTVVYHLTSTVYRHTIVVKIKLDHQGPEVRTVCDVWRTAEFHEREAFDLMG